MPRRRFPWPIDEMTQMYESGMSLQEISDRLGSEEWQPYWKDRIGKEYSPSQKIVNKAMLRAGATLRSRGAPLDRNGFWKGGRVIDKDGYVLVKAPNHPHSTKSGYVREHRLVMEKTLGRYMLPQEVVHHRDGNTQNNDPENLELFATNSDHLSETTHGSSPDKTREAIRVVAERRRAWWPMPTILRWHFDDGLQLAQIGELLGMVAPSVAKALRRNGHAPRRIPHQRAVPIEERHRREAAEALAMHHPDKGRDGQECSETTRR